jgi:hypothetical protein
MQYGHMRYKYIIITIFLIVVVKFGLAQENWARFSKIDSIALTDVRKASIEQFLKFRPTYKLLSCIVRVYSKGIVVQFPYPEDKNYSSFELTKRGALKDDVIIFDDINIVNGEKKIYLTPKAYVVK